MNFRTLQYLVIPLLSLGIFAVGIIHLGNCTSQPYLPIWQIVAGTSGVVLWFIRHKAFHVMRFKIYSSFDNLFFFKKVIPLRKWSQLGITIVCFYHASNFSFCFYQVFLLPSYTFFLTILIHGSAEKFPRWQNAVTIS